MKKIAFLFSILCIFLLVACGGQKSQQQENAPAQHSNEQHKMENMEDPKPIITQINQAISDTEAKVQSGKFADARLFTGNIVTLTNQLSTHITDNDFRDRLKQAATTLNNEVNKTEPNKEVVNNQLEILKKMMNEVPNKLMAH